MWVVSTDRSIAQYRRAFTFITVVPGRGGGRRLDINIDGRVHIFDFDPATANHLSQLLAVSRLQDSAGDR